MSEYSEKFLKYLDKIQYSALIFYDVVTKI